MSNLSTKHETREQARLPDGRGRGRCEGAAAPAFSEALLFAAAALALDLVGGLVDSADEHLVPHLPPRSDRLNHWE